MLDERDHERNSDFRKQPTPPSSPGWQGTLVKVLAFTVVAATAPLAKDCGKAIGGPIGRFVGGAVHRSQAPSSWTPEAKSTYFGKTESRTTLAHVPGVLTAADSAEIEKCIEGKFMSATPRGPRQAEDLGQARMESLAREAGAACAQQYFLRITTSDRWIPEWTPIFIKACVKGGGEGSRLGCACTAREAPKYFDNPKALTSAMSLDASDSRVASGSSLSRLNRACGLPDPQDMKFEIEKAEKNARESERQLRTWGFTAADIAELRSCNEEELKRAVPETASQDEVSAATQRVSQACARRIVSRYEQASRWSDQAFGLAKAGCADQRDRDMRAACLCLGEEGPIRFASPVKYAAAKSMSKEKRTASDARALEEASRTCALQLEAPDLDASLLRWFSNKVADLSPVELRALWADAARTNAKAWAARGVGTRERPLDGIALEPFFEQVKVARVRKAKGLSLLSAK
jgi:hypothetical protein